MRDDCEERFVASVVEEGENGCFGVVVIEPPGGVFSEEEGACVFGVQFPASGKIPLKGEGILAGLKKVCEEWTDGITGGIGEMIREGSI